jgi:hypothetical protein
MESGGGSGGVGMGVGGSGGGGVADTEGGPIALTANTIYGGGGGLEHRVHIFTRDDRVSVSAHSAGAYTATLLVNVNVMKGGGRAPPTLTSLG